MMKSYSRLVFTFLFSPLAVQAQTGAPKGASLQRLKATVQTLVQPAWGGRLAGTPGNELARKWVIGQFKSIGLAPAGNRDYEHFIRSRLSFRVGGANVIGTLGPVGPDSRCVLIGAHFDGLGFHDGALYPGADDNASGVAVLLEIARLIQPRRGELKQCVIFAAWDFEEGDISTLGGVKGSTYYTLHPTIPLKNIQLAIAFDLIGGSFFEGAENLFFMLGTETSSVLRKLHAQTQQPTKVVPKLASVSIIEPLGPRIPRSDYGPFRNNGVPFLFFTTGTPIYYHTPMDTIDKLDFAKMAGIAEYVTSYLWPLMTTDQKVIAGEPLQDTRVQDTVTLSELLPLLLTHKNPLVPYGMGLISKDIALLKNSKGEIRKDVQVCRLQLMFIDILDALGSFATNGRIENWIAGHIAGKCESREASFPTGFLSPF